MKITRLILKGYKPFLFNNIENLEYTPASLYQLIIGTNGSGKSSLLEEINPLPGVPANYIKGGKKEVWLEHRGSQYHLISEFASGNKHTFIKDDEILHNAGNGAIQKELVMQHFGLNQELQDLLSGRIKFTDLGPLKRREWLTQICETDFDYVLGVHQRLRSHLRDLQGAIKNIRNRLTNETNKLMSLTDMDQVDEEYRALHHELNLLFQERPSDVLSTKELEGQIHQQLVKVEEISQKIVKHAPRCVIAGKTYQSIDDVLEDIQQIQTSIQVNESLRDRIAQESEELNQLVEGFHASGTDGVEGAKKRIEELEKELGTLRGTTQHFHEVPYPQETLQAFHYSVDNLVEVMRQLPNGEATNYNREKLQQAENQRMRTIEELNTLTNRGGNVESRIEHLLSTRDVECPKCTYRWKPGVSEHEVEKLRQQVAETQDKRQQAQKKLEELDTYIEVAQEHAGLYRSLRELRNQTPFLKPLWDVLFEMKAFTDNPSGKIPYLYTFEKDTEILGQIAEREREMKDLSDLLEGANKQGDLTGFTQRVEKLHAQMENTTQEIQTQQRQLESLKQYRRTIEGTLSLHRELDDHIERLYHLRQQMIQALRGEGIEKIIIHHQNTLAELQRKRSQKKAIEDIIEDLKKNENELERDIGATEALVKGLSPTDGLIAQQLSGFINGFIESLNQMISNIWTYDFVVKPCGLEEGELDYRFPIEVRTKPDPVPDIAKGSTAQIEVVNLVFRLVAALYLRFQDYPLYLDEVGGSFDEQHRINVMEVLKRLVDTGSYSQMFMISHYAGQYQHFKTGETLVLDPSNIVVPGTYNEHVVMN